MKKPFASCLECLRPCTTSEILLPPGPNYVLLQQSIIPPLQQSQPMFERATSISGRRGSYGSKPRQYFSWDTTPAATSSQRHRAVRQLKLPCKCVHRGVCPSAYPPFKSSSCGLDDLLLEPMTAHKQEGGAIDQRRAKRGRKRDLQSRGYEYRTSSCHWGTFRSMATSSTVVDRPLLYHREHIARHTSKLIETSFNVRRM